MNKFDWYLVIFLSLIFLITGSAAFGKDNWQCEQTGFSRTGNTLSGCGVGEGRTESEARKHSLDNVIDEFKSVCSLSEDCRSKQVNAIPKRMSCKESKLGWKCARMVVFEIGENDSKMPVVANLSPDSAQASKIRRGLSKREVSTVLGEPISVYESGSWVYWRYKGHVCEDGAMYCSIAFSGPSVDYALRIKPEYLDYQ